LSTIGLLQAQAGVEFHGPSPGYGLGAGNARAGPRQLLGHAEKLGCTGERADARAGRRAEQEERKWAVAVAKRELGSQRGACARGFGPRCWACPARHVRLATGWFWLLGF
jgi:hypothetical protein